MTDYEMLLHKEVLPALGCTEPTAVAYAAAWAKKILDRKVERLEVLGSRNILKNGMSVGIPGSNMTGLPIAAALGALAGRTDIGLEVLRDVSPEDEAAGKRMIEEGHITIRQKHDTEPLYIEVRAFGQGHSATAIIRRTHTMVTDLLRDGTIIMHVEPEAAVSAKREPDAMTIQGIWRFCITVPLEKLKFLHEGIKMNLAAAQEGLRIGYGMSVGQNLASAGRDGNILSSDMGTSAAATTAAACDARMAGASVPVMSVAGSGNQGLVSMLPVAVFAQMGNADEERLLRGTALSILTTIRIKQSIGRLSALCGCAIAAAIGASCGILYVLGGSEIQAQYAIKNMIANITGMVCDGAKSGCAVKAATSVSAAVQCAILAMNDAFAPDIDGIVENDVEKTIENLGSIGRDGMAQTDHLILDLMTGKAASAI